MFSLCFGESGVLTPPYGCDTSGFHFALSNRDNDVVICLEERAENCAAIFRCILTTEPLDCRVGEIVTSDEEHIFQVLDFDVSVKPVARQSMSDWQIQFLWGGFSD